MGRDHGNICFSRIPARRNRVLTHFRNSTRTRKERRRLDFRPDQQTQLSRNKIPQAGRVWKNQLTHFCKITLIAEEKDVFICFSSRGPAGVQTVIDPHFDHCLPGNIQLPGLFVERFDHPAGKSTFTL